MAEGLFDVDGKPVDIDASEAAFAAAMAAPPADKPGHAAPAKKPPQPAADPDNAPYGWMFEGGEWRAKKAPGRQKTGDRPRVTDQPPPQLPTRPPAAKPDAKADKPSPYAHTVTETLEAVWFVLSSTPIPEQAFGFKLGRIRARLRAQAAIIEANDRALTAGTVTIAEHSPMVARALDRLKSGKGGLWVLPTLFMLAPFAAQSAQLWSGKLSEAELDAIAAQVEEQAADYVKQLSGVLEAEPAQA